EITQLAQVVAILENSLNGSIQTVSALGAGKSQRLLRISGETAHDLDLPPAITAIDIGVTETGETWLLGQISEARYGLWRDAGTGWRMSGHFEAGQAVELRIIGGRPTVAGTIDGQGAVWGLPARREPCSGASPNTTINRCAEATDTPPETNPLPETLRVSGHRGNDGISYAAALKRMRDDFADRRSYLGHGRVLRDSVDRTVRLGMTGRIFTEMLNGPFPEGEVKLIGGRAVVSHQRLAHWILAWALRRVGEGEVPASWLGQPFDEPRNESEKYFSEALSAIWTVAATGQDDPATVAALRARAANDDDPAWLRADARAALRILETR
uniref:hypothetical protein n=1 Tax=Minwuia sp. TaxID=2493630 RepID=UPI003A8CFB25